MRAGREAGVMLWREGLSAGALVAAFAAAIALALVLAL